MPIWEIPGLLTWMLDWLLGGTWQFVSGLWSTLEWMDLLECNQSYSQSQVENWGLPFPKICWAWCRRVVCSCCYWNCKCPYHDWCHQRRSWWHNWRSTEMIRVWMTASWVWVFVCCQCKWICQADQTWKLPNLNATLLRMMFFGELKPSKGLWNCPMWSDRSPSMKRLGVCIDSSGVTNLHCIKG